MSGQKPTEEFKPLACVWELTLRCNLRCLHCGSRAGRRRQEELTLDEMLRVADELAELGNERTTLSGGEPLLRSEWPQIAGRLTGQGVVVNMISNGYAFDDRTLDLARAAKMVSIGFSLDGDEATHNMIRARPDAYRRVMSAIDLCATQGYPVGVITHVIKANLHQLDDLARHLVDSGVGLWQIQLGFDWGNLSDHPELVLEPDDLRVIIPKVAALKQRYAGRLRIHPADDMGYYTEEELVLREQDGAEGFWTGCQAGLSVVGIEANGNVKGCLSMQSDRFIEGNLRDESFRQIWTGGGAFAFTRQFRLDDLGGFCRECRYNEICRGGCSWNGFIHGQQEGARSNRYCLYQVYELQGEADSGSLKVSSS